MAFLKKILALFILLAACGYLSMAWEARSRDNATAERIVQKLGEKVVSAAASANDICRATARVEHVSVERDWFDSAGSAKLFIAGRNATAMFIEYTLSFEGDRVYVQPKNPDRARQTVFDFVSNRCS